MHFLDVIEELNKLTVESCISCTDLGKQITRFGFWKWLTLLLTTLEAMEASHKDGKGNGAEAAILNK
jgi:hypothetical protein